MNLILKEKNIDHISVVMYRKHAEFLEQFHNIYELLSRRQKGDEFNNPHVQCRCSGQGLISRVWTVLLSVQPSSASKATTSMKCVTPWARTCSTPWRRTTVWIGSVAAPCGPSASTSWTTSGRRSSPSPGRSSACPASSPVVYKRWTE